MVFSVPQREGEADTLVVVTEGQSAPGEGAVDSRDTGDTVLAPSVRPALGHLEWERVPGVSVGGVVLSHGTLRVSPSPGGRKGDSPIVARRHTVPIASSVPRSGRTGPVCRSED